MQNSDLFVSSTSFGGIHSSVDRRARWGDPVGEGFARISAGIEDTDDLIADIEHAALTADVKQPQVAAVGHATFGRGGSLSRL